MKTPFCTRRPHSSLSAPRRWVRRLGQSGRWPFMVFFKVCIVWSSPIRLFRSSRTMTLIRSFSLFTILLLSVKVAFLLLFLLL